MIRADTVPAILSECSSRGIRLWAAAGSLEVAAPPGVVDAGDLATLRIYKPDILRSLAGEAVDAGAAGSPSPVAAVPPTWRGIVARWPVDARERWGRRANDLQDSGHSWWEAERLAFGEINGGPIREDQEGLLAAQGGSGLDKDVIPAWIDDASLMFSRSDFAGLE